MPTLKTIQSKTLYRQWWWGKQNDFSERSDHANSSEMQTYICWRFCSMDVRTGGSHRQIIEHDTPKHFNIDGKSMLISSSREQCTRHWKGTPKGSQKSSKTFWKSIPEKVPKRTPKWSPKSTKAVRVFGVILGVIFRILAKKAQDGALMGQEGDK